MDTRHLGTTGPETAPIGLGCEGLSSDPVDRATSVATIRAALDAGIALLDTGDFYGMGDNEELIREALRPDRREKTLLSVKFGGLRDPEGRFVGIGASPAQAKNFLTYSLRRLGTDHVDLYRPARLDPAVPIEETVGALAELVEAGYVRHIGLSEVGSETIRRAAAVHPIADVQLEYSLFSRSIENSVLDTCRELGIGVTAYGVLAHGLLTGSWQPSPADRVHKAHLPRFQGENLQANLALVENLRDLADGHGVSVAQLAIAWVLAQDEKVVALVGARRPQRIADLVAATQLRLNPSDLAAVERAVPIGAVAGTRYAAPLMALLDSER